MAAVRRFLWENGLSLVTAAVFALLIAGQSCAGWHTLNEDRGQHERPELAYSEYLTSPHFFEATFENWESEFLQMGFYVLLTVFLRQRGSAESKPLDGRDEVDADPRRWRFVRGVPWPVRRGGIALKLYEHSLTAAFGLLFAASLALHAISGWQLDNQERAAHGLPGLPLTGYVTGARFWFESFQNWQSEFLAVLAIVVLSIFLRERGSPQSKPVAAEHAETGG